MSKRYIDVDAAVSNAEACYGEWNLAMAAAEGNRQINIVYKKQELFKAVKKVVENCVTIDPETLQPKWRNPETDPPKVETEVLILYRDDIDGYSITTAHYEDGSVFLQDSVWHWEDLPDWGTYDEERDDYKIPKGWWEYRHFNPDDVYNNKIDCTVVGWMPLPPKEMTQNGNQ